VINKKMKKCGQGGVVQALYAQCLARPEKARSGLKRMKGVIKAREGLIGCG